MWGSVKVSSLEEDGMGTGREGGEAEGGCEAGWPAGGHSGEL